MTYLYVTNSPESTFSRPVVKGTYASVTILFYLCKLFFIEGDPQFLEDRTTGRNERNDRFHQDESPLTLH